MLSNFKRWLCPILLLVVLTSAESFSQEDPGTPNAQPLPVGVTLLGYIEVEESPGSRAQPRRALESKIVVMLKVEDQIILLREGEEMPFQFKQTATGDAVTPEALPETPTKQGKALLQFSRETLDTRNKSLLLGAKPFGYVKCELGKLALPWMPSKESNADELGEELDNLPPKLSKQP